MHKFKVSMGHKRLFAWKIDLSKAYDRLSWRFIEPILGAIGLPLNLIQLIMSYTTFVSYQVCVNGELTDSFRHKIVLDKESLFLIISLFCALKNYPT